MIWNFLNYLIGKVYFYQCIYNKAIKYLIKANKQGEHSLCTKTFLFCSYKHLSKKYDEVEIHSLIKKEGGWIAENIEFEINLRLYDLFEDTSYF